MKNLKPIGIPHSIILENIFPRTFDASKLDEDADRVRQAYRDKGYFKANTGEPETNVRNAGGINPLHAASFDRQARRHPHPGRRRRTLPPRRHHVLGQQGLHQCEGAARAVRSRRTANYFNATIFGKGLEALRKAYGEGGYINMVPTPVPRSMRPRSWFTWTSISTKASSFTSRASSSRATRITRDKVIRREILVEEGQVYNSRLVDLSLLRLNQLNYFDTLKAEQDVETRQNADAGTVDLLIKLHEKGKNSIGLNGGVSAACRARSSA